MSLKQIQSSIAQDMRAVDEVIRSSLYSDVVLIKQVAYRDWETDRKSVV